MPNVLVVDDSEIDRLRVQTFLTGHRSDLTTQFANDGLEALASIAREIPDLIVTDLQMPNMNGLELVSRIKEFCPLIPIILMTAEGSEEIAAEALDKGAISYVPKSMLKEHLPQTVDRTLEVSFRDREHSRLMHALTRSETDFHIQNDPDLIEMATNFYQEMLRCVPLGDESDRFRVGTAIKHALWHGWYFGNLQIDSTIEDTEEFHRLVDERSATLPYCNRALTIAAKITPLQAEFRIVHEGAPLTIPERGTSIAFSGAPFHRGFVLMSAIMDRVETEENGQAIVMTKMTHNSKNWTILNSQH